MEMYVDELKNNMKLFCFGGFFCNKRPANVTTDCKCSKKSSENKLWNININTKISKNKIDDCWK